MNEVAIQKHVVVMKSGLSILVSPETSERISNHLVNQGGHSFLKIAETGQVINTAEIEGVYTPEKHAEMLRIKGGEYLCSYNRWHKKREQCECQIELRKERENEMRRIQNAEQNRPMTTEEKANSLAIIQRMKRESPIGKKVKAYTLKRSALIEYERKYGFPFEMPPDTVIEEDLQETPAI